MPGRLNIFQRTMLLWNDLHPYNAVHVVRVLAPLDLPRLGEVVNRTMQKQGLGTVTLDPRRGTYRYEDGGANYEIRRIEVGENPHAGLASETERQLNTGFGQDQRFSPFRFFVATEPGSFF